MVLKGKCASKCSCKHHLDFVAIITSIFRDANHFMQSGPAGNRFLDLYMHSWDQRSSARHAHPFLFLHPPFNATMNVVLPIARGRCSTRAPASSFFSFPQANHAIIGKTTKVKWGFYRDRRARWGGRHARRPCKRHSFLPCPIIYPFPRAR